MQNINKGSLMRRFSLIITILVISWWLLPSQQSASDNITDDLEFIKAVMDEGNIPGLAIGVIKNNKVVLQQGFGFANVKSEQPVTQDTPFNIASISKPIMGISLLQLVEQGKLDLDEDLNTYLPFTLDNPHVQGEKITLRSISSHSSGIADFYDPNTFGQNKDPDTSLAQWVEQSLSIKGALYNSGAYFLPLLPGAEREYSNLSAALAGYLVELVSESDLIDFNKKYLLDPLGMNSTDWRVADFDLTKVATPYTPVYCVPLTAICAGPDSYKSRYLISTIFNPAENDRSYIAYDHYGYPDYPAGGLRSTVKDMNKFMLMILNGGELDGKRYLSKGMFNEMMSLQLSEEVSTRQRFFWRDNKSGMTGHQGSDPGVYAKAYFDLDKKDAIVILVNRSPDLKMMNALDRINDRFLGNSNPID
jgi:CubicO group peptidase (beta-lactamase class C family)